MSVDKRHPILKRLLGAYEVAKIKRGILEEKFNLYEFSEDD